MHSFGATCADAIRAHLVSSGLKWSQLNGEAVAKIIDAQFAIHFPRPAVSRRVNGRDLLFDAIATTCGVDLTGLTRNYAKQIATAKRDIQEATPDVTPEEIERRGAAYRAKYHGAALTPMALASRWPEFGAGPSRGTRGSRADVYQEPLGWKESPEAQAALRVSPGTWANVVAAGWFELSVDLRASILKAMHLVN